MLYGERDTILCACTYVYKPYNYNAIMYCTLIVHSLQRVGGSWRSEELNQWMKAKREERMTKFREHREKLLKSEKHPFKPPKAGTKVGATKLRSSKQEKLKRYPCRFFMCTF